MLLWFFEWCDGLAFGHFLRGSVWLFAAIESVHLLGLATMGGAVLLVDLGLLRVLLRAQPVAELAQDARPYLVGGLLAMLISGPLMLICEPLRCYYSPAFWVKMTCLGLAILFTFTVRNRVALAAEGQVAGVWSKAVGLISIVLWSGVGLGGRGIAFF